MTGILLYFSFYGDFMPQLQLPIFSADAVDINGKLLFKNDAGTITYFHGIMPVFSHNKNDLKAFRMITSQFYVNGTVTQAEIVRAFGVTPQSVKRAVKLYREKGIDGFYAPRNTRGAAVLTDEIIENIQQRLNNKNSIADIAMELDLKPNTIDKAVRAGRLHNPFKKKI